MRTTFVVLVALVLPRLAVADPAVDAKVTTAIVDTIKMTRDGQLDAWITKYCDPQRCHDENAIASWKAYQLQSATRFGKYCLSDKGTLTVTRKRGDPAVDTTARWYLQCTNRTLPVPIEFRWDKAASRVWIVTLSF